MKKLKPLYKESPDPQVYVTISSQTLAYCKIQRIPPKRDWVNVLRDSGASLCFITNDKAKAERLKGTKFELSIIKVGGDNEKVASTRYKLSLIDKQGREVQFDVYGIDKITLDIRSVNVNGIVNCLKIFLKIYQDPQEQSTY